MIERSRASRFAVVTQPKVIQSFSLDRGPWFETPEEVQRGIEWGREKAVLLRWVRNQMEARLTLRERRCVELYYFYGKTFREAGELTGTNASSVYRAVQRSLRKLRQAAASGGLRRLRVRRRGGAR